MTLFRFRATRRFIAPLLVLAGAVFTAMPLASAQQGDPAAAEPKKRMCEGCHGIRDYRNAYPDVYRVPKLGGQTATYIAKALQDYKSGARTHAAMRAVAASLTEQDISDLAAYYAGSGAK
jgi:cytochrome c553